MEEEDSDEEEEEEDEMDVGFSMMDINEVVVK